MELFLSALRWIFDPTHWEAGSRSPLPIQDRLLEHLQYTAVSMVIATASRFPSGATSATPVADVSSSSPSPAPCAPCPRWGCSTSC